MSYDPYNNYVTDDIVLSNFVNTEWNNTLVAENHPVLHEAATIDPFSVKCDWAKREEEMFDLMHERLGIGLAAPQLGNSFRMFVMSHRYLGEIGIYNPRILQVSDSDSTFTEGCLSWPLLYIPKSRPEAIKVSWTKNDGTTQVEVWMDGIDATCFQHELDHLNGVTFIDGVSDFKLRRAKEKRDKALKVLAKAQAKKK